MEINRRRFSFATASAAIGGCVSGTPPPRPSWRQLRTETYQGKQDDIFFVSADIGWYGNGAGKLYRTLDGGEIWTKVWEQPGTFIRALGFLDAENGFLGNIGTGYYPNVTDTNPLYRTRDGGLSWAPVDGPNIEVAQGICGIDIVRERRMLSSTARIVHAAGRVGGPAALLRSVDGGETWRTIDLDSQAGMILDVKFFDARNGLLCAATSDDLEQANALILRTSDGGETWVRAYQSSRRFENCWKMSFPSRQVGYATVQNYEEGATQRVIVKATDGGASWRELPLVDDAGVREFGIGFVDDRWGWVGTSTTGYETRDGGATWAPVEMGRAVNKIRILREGSHLRVFAIGSQVHRYDG